MNSQTSSSGRKTIRIAAVQAAPVFLNKAATTEKVCSLIHEAGANGADVIGFPESFIPCYPAWNGVLPLSLEPAPSLFRRLFNEAVEVPGPEIEAIQGACKHANIYGVVGINERRPNTTGTFYNTQVIIGRNGELLHKHQKYMPTAGERLIHAPGKTGSKASAQTHFGCLSSLICGENGNPLAQYSVSLDYPVVHVASWPSHFCPGQEMQDNILAVSRGFANSLSCYVMNSVAVVDDDAIREYGTNPSIREYLEEEKKKKEKSRGATIVGPGGQILAGPLEKEEGILFADVNLDSLTEIKYILDYAGHYNRPELFAHHFRQYFED